MGSLSYPLNPPVYIDANCLIYSVERVQPYAPLLDGFWRWNSAQGVVVLTSALAVLESLIGPLKAGNQRLELRFRRVLFRSANLSLIPITNDILEHAAQLRAQIPALKTPDAIHAASALKAGVATFLTNDKTFQHVPGLKVVAPHDLPTP